MREETIVEYIADDGTPFNTDRYACQQYEVLCQKYKEWLRTNKVVFWSHYKKYMNPDLTEYSFGEGDGVNYLDWLKQRLPYGCGHVVINEHPCSGAWAEVWEFVTKFLAMDSSTIHKLEPTYRLGDILSFDERDCKFHNIDYVARNVMALRKSLSLDCADSSILDETATNTQFTIKIGASRYLIFKIFIVLYIKFQSYSKINKIKEFEND